MSRAFDKVSKYRLRFVGRGMDLLPVETGEVYAADEVWIRLSHAEHAAIESIAAAVRAARAEIVAASEVALDRAERAKPGEQPPQSEVPEGCSARMIHGFEAFEHAKAQAVAWMKTAQTAQAALALAEQEKQALRAEVERKDAALREWQLAKAHFVEMDGDKESDARWEAAEKALVDALSPAAPEPSKPEDRR